MDFTLGATEAERRRRENLGAEGEEGVEFGEGVFTSSTDYGVWESVVSSHSGIRSGTPAANAFLSYLRPTEHGYYVPTKPHLLSGTLCHCLLDLLTLLAHLNLV